MANEATHHPLVAINAHLLAGEASYRSAGIAVYILNLLRHLSADRDALDYRVLLGQQGRVPDDVTLPVTQSRMTTRHPVLRVLWEQARLPGLLQHLRADLLHATAFVGPWRAPCPQVITVHDLSFLRHPEFFRQGNRRYLGMMTGVACRRAAAVIAVSQFTASEVTALLGVPAERVHVVYHGIDPRYRPLPQDVIAQFRADKGLPERFILHMGTLEPRKNLLHLIRAFARLRDPESYLVLAGGCGWFYAALFAEVKRLGLEDRVLFPGFVPADEQILWYNSARAFAYPSLYEGFGLPVLESLACGVPTVTSATTSLPEVAGNAALTVPPDDEDALVAALQRLLDDAALRETLRHSGLARAAQFTWEATAEQTVQIYQQMIASRRAR